jgi:hypothetical protein
MRNTIMLTTTTDGTEGREPGRAAGLLALNAALLGALALIEFGPGADAQARARGEYVIVSGGVPHAQADAVYIIDTINQEMVAIQYDINDRDLRGIGYANLAADGSRLLAAGTRPSN